MIELTLPFPPTTNSIWRTVSHGRLAGRTLLSAKARSFYTACGHAVMVQSANRRLQGRLTASLAFAPPDKRRRDLDNLLKATFDALHKCNVIEDDSQIDELRVVRMPPVKGGNVRIKLEVIRDLGGRQ